jgi:hypothetical protein
MRDGEVFGLPGRATSVSMFRYSVQIKGEIPGGNRSGFSAYADVGNVLTGFSLGKTGQLRIMSDPVIGVLRASFRDIISRSSSSSDGNAMGRILR